MLRRARAAAPVRRRRSAARADSRADGTGRRCDRSARAATSSARRSTLTAARLQHQIYDFAGEEFNIGSPQQLGNDSLRKAARFRAARRTKTGWATGVEVLQGLAREYPICALVLEWREVTKLKNTYIDVIPELLDPRDGRLHTVFNQTATATGRLSSTNPNLQNIPGARRARPPDSHGVRRADARARAARRGLQPDRAAADGTSLGRRGDAPGVRRRSGHSRFHGASDLRRRRRVATVDGNQRRMAKSVNFGLLYGMSDFGLAQRLEIGRAEAREITEAYFARFPVGARLYRPDDRRGRARRLRHDDPRPPPLHAGPDVEQLHAALGGRARGDERTAARQCGRSHEARDGAASIARSRAAKLDATMLLQIHDELIFEVRRDDVERRRDLVRAEMENAIALSVPLEVTLKSARIGTTSKRAIGRRARCCRVCLTALILAAALPTIGARAESRPEPRSRANRSAARARIDEPHVARAARRDDLRLSTDGPIEFWMKDTLIPLDMVFVGADGTVRKIYHRVPVAAARDAGCEDPARSRHGKVRHRVGRRRCGS